MQQGYAALVGALNGAAPCTVVFCGESEAAGGQPCKSTRCSEHSRSGKQSRRNFQGSN